MINPPTLRRVRGVPSSRHRSTSPSTSTLFELHIDIAIHLDLDIAIHLEIDLEFDIDIAIHIDLDLDLASFASRRCGVARPLPLPSPGDTRGLGVWGGPSLRRHWAGGPKIHPKNDV